MDKLNMQTANIADENFKKLAELFPNAVTETINENGEIVRAIDKDVLMQEINTSVVEGREERYQFTWPDKRKAIIAANAPTTNTLRPCREDSVNFDTTENLYIEGDNLEVLKLLQENYLGQVKMIYIDPPYNTGNDFVYEDDFAESTAEYLANSGQYDEDGNRLTANTESNGRFHTDWLNMIYPRLKVARNLLTEDGVIFISIDDGELNNLKRMCDEIFGASNFRNTILVRRRIKSLNSQFADNGLSTMNVAFEYILVYAKSDKFLMKALRQKKADVPTKGRWDVFWSNADRPTMRYDILGFTPTSGQWRNGKDKAEIAVNNYKKYIDEYSSKMSLEEYSEMTGIKDFIRRIPNATGKNGGVQHWVAPSDTMLRTSNWTDIEVSQIGKEIDLPFDNPKSKLLLMELIKLVRNDNSFLVLDFFSGSATTAHAVMQLNSEDGGNRTFIMVQLPQLTDEESDANIAGYKNICEIGKERIRRAAKKIKEDNPDAQFDAGFRVLKLDTSNMQQVYYTPETVVSQSLWDTTVDNIKVGRTSEDLLFQAMLELNVPLSSPIKKETIDGKEVFNVADGYILACFDNNLTDEIITDIAKRKPYFFVMRDSSMADDSVAVNFEQLFKSYSPETILKVF